MSAKQYRVLKQTLENIKHILKTDLYEEEMTFIKGRIKTYKLMADIRKHVPEYTIPQFPDLIDQKFIKPRHIQYFEFQMHKWDNKGIFDDIRNIMAYRICVYYDILKVEKSKGIYFVYNMVIDRMIDFNVLVFQYLWMNKLDKKFYACDSPFNDSFHARVNHVITDFS
jgi:hypothetical protein